MPKNIPLSLLKTLSTKMIGKDGVPSQKELDQSIRL